jgi:AraC-like DNA-binding protein
MQKLKPDEILENILLDIEKGVKRNIDTVALAQKYGLSERHLRKLFTSAFNYSMGSYIRSRKLTASIDDLLNTDSKIIFIAVEHGFEHESSYIKAFKNEYGITPGQFRKSGHNVTVKPPIQLNARKSQLISEKQIHNARKNVFYRLTASVNIFGGAIQAFQRLLICTGWICFV